MVDDKYFETIDTHEKAYILGLVLFNFKEKYNGIYFAANIEIIHNTIKNVLSIFFAPLK